MQFLSLQNQIKRLKFAIRYRHWTNEWLQVSFLDEKTVQTYANGRVAVKRKVNERYNADKIVVSESQNSKNKVNLVGTVCFNGPNVIYSVSTNFTEISSTSWWKGKLKVSSITQRSWWTTRRSILRASSIYGSVAFMFSTSRRKALI